MPLAGEGVDVRGRSAEARPVEQVGGLGAVPLVGREGHEHREKKGGLMEFN